MMTQRRGAILHIGLGAALVGLAFLEIVADYRFERQSANVSTQEDSTVTNWQSYLMTPRQRVTARDSDDTPWMAHLRTVDQALAEKKLSDAEQAWDEAYLAALRSRRWAGMVEAGDAARRIGEVAGLPKAGKVKARGAYFAALFRARQERSIEGVLRVAEAFGDVGDREVARQCLRIAERLATRTRDPDSSERVQAVSERMASQSYDRIP